MPKIRIERLPIEKYHLGILGFDHLQLAFEQDSLTSVPIPQEEWYVIEGTLVESNEGNKLGALGQGGSLPMWLTSGGHRGDVLEAHIGTPETRGSRVIATENAQAIWDKMAAHARDIVDQWFDYRGYGTPGSLLPTLNSTSFIASVLYFAGLDVASNMPHGLRRSPGASTLLGSLDDDHLKISGQFNAIFSGGGKDFLEGTDTVTLLDRLYGGGDNDLFKWSAGKNYMHGGDSSWSYKEDGLDTINYSGSGGVHIDLVPGWIEHTTPQYMAYTTQSIDYLMSIERLLWNDNTTEEITVGPGVELIQTPLSIYLGGESADAGNEKGDTLDLSETTTGLVINRANEEAMFVSSPSQQGEGGLWIESAEWIVATGGDDKIYAYEGLRGIEGGGGNDFIDAHLVAAFVGKSPEGYDIEITGGDGDDTIVSNAGKTYIDGGAGADRIVLAAVTTDTGSIEYVIDGADSDDTLFIPYNYFNESGDAYDNSDLMQIAGAIGTFDQLVNEGWELFYENLYQEHYWNGDDELSGVINFAGSISFLMEGSDLLIYIYQADRVTETYEIDDTGATATRDAKIIRDETETIVRVLDFSEGDLGLQFIDPGQFYTQTYNGENVTAYTNWNSAVDTLNPNMLDPFEAPPAAPDTDPNDPDNAPPPPNRQNGSDTSDQIALLGPAIVDAGAGDDTITSEGSHNDTIDGGTGADQMAGGQGNDHYYVDDPGDAVIEGEFSGIDTVISSIDYTLAPHVENVTLSATASAGTGNALANTIAGNAEGNTLTGLEGDDWLAGGLGDDILVGGSGSDTYTYVRGDGNDVIDDGGTGPLESDTLWLHGSIMPGDLTAFRIANAPEDLILAIAGGGRITIADFFAGDGSGIERIAFDDGTKWDRAAIDALAQSAPVLTTPPPDAVNDYGLVFGGTDGVLLAAPLLANDQDPAGSALTLQSVTDLSIGTATIDADGNIVLDLPAGYEGPLTFRYTAVNASGVTSSASVEMFVVPNAAPISSGPVSGQSAFEGQTWSFAVPLDHFSDPDGDALVFFATLADGSPLPGWLTFNTVTAAFTGTPPTGSAATLDIIIEAYDGFVTTAVAFELTIAAADATEPDRTLTSTSADEVLTGGTGNDTFRVLGNDTGSDVFVGGAGTDTIVGSESNDTIRLAADPANLSGIEIIDVGGGYDTLVLSASDDTLDLSAVLVTGLELIDAGAGSDHVIGSAGNDVIRGNAGDDTLDGGNGDDIFTVLGGAEGFDLFKGGSGFDAILASQWNDIISLANVTGNLDGIEAIDGGGGSDTIRLTSGNDTLDLSAIAVNGIELIDAGSGNDHVIGSAGNDVIRGNAGDDTLFGGGGDDIFTVVGGAEGSDKFDGGAGYDTIQGSAWNDVIALAATAGSLASIEAIASGDGNDTLRLASSDDTLDLSAVLITGLELIDAGAGNDNVVGSAGNDVIRGNAGDDSLFGGGGDDIFTVVGGAEGFDVFNGGSGYDTILASQWNDIIALANVTGNLDGIEAIEGGRGSDTIRLTSGNDTLDLSAIAVTGIELIDAGAGNDVITGSTSNDMLRGGSGSDTFVVLLGGGNDTVLDFEIAASTGAPHDLLDLSDAGFADLAAVYAASYDDGGNTIITIGATETVTLYGVALSALTADHLLIA